MRLSVLEFWYHKGCPAALSETTDITNTYRVCVMSKAVRTYLFDRPTFVDGSVEVDKVVVADVRKATCFVPSAYVCHGRLTTGRRSGAVYDDFVDLTHSCFLLEQLSVWEIHQMNSVAVVSVCCKV